MQIEKFIAADSNIATLDLGANRGGFDLDFTSSVQVAPFTTQREETGVVCKVSEMSACLTQTDGMNCCK